MRYYALVNEGLEQTARQEIEEKLGVKVEVHKTVLEFTSDSKINLQSVRRLLTAITKNNNLEKLELKNLPRELFTSETKFKIVVEGVKGQENRLEIAGKAAEQIFQSLKPITPLMEFKKPEFLVVIFFNGTDYFIGIDKSITELNARPYRVFPHSASFKGDLAFHFVKLSGFAGNKNFLSGFCKDGAIAMEASRYADEIVYAFDESTMNVTAAKKNVKISKTKVDVKKSLLEDLDILYNEFFFDYCIFHVTAKDERKLNEIYHQARYILKSGGMLMFIARPSWEVSISDSFDLVKDELIKKGDGGYKVWVLRKK